MFFNECRFYRQYDPNIPDWNPFIKGGGEYFTKPNIFSEYKSLFPKEKIIGAIATKHW